MVFGDFDLRGKASDKLLHLKMKDTGRLHRYTVRFKEAADDLSWPDSVLRQLYYNGLPDRVKNVWSKSDPPSTLDELIHQAQCADNRY